MVKVDDLVIMNANEVKQGRELLNRAFGNDPHFLEMLKSEPDCHNMTPLFDFILRSGIKEGGTFVKDSEEMKGLALIVPAGVEKSAFADFPFIGFAYMLWKYKFSTVKRLAALNARAAEIHKKIISDKHYYLSIIGVDPKYQGQGVGKKILLSITQAMDQEQMPLYLETQNHKNVSIYKKYGFEVVHEEILKPFFQAPVYYMLRMPK